MRPLSVYLGYDQRQPLAAQVLAHSLWKAASVPLAITRIELRLLPITRRGLTEFTYSRFLVPYLCDYEGVSLFLDSDILCRADVLDLLSYPLAYPMCEVFVVPHAKRFERPSVMVFNNERCRVLTPSYIDDESHPLMPLEWATNVGALPPAWNHLVGYDAPNPDAKLVHFTQGIPCWPETKDCEFAGEWVKAAKSAMSTVSFQALMGQSVHVRHMKEQAHSAVSL